MMKSLAAVLLLSSFSINASDLDHRVTYWIAESDSTGWTVQNIGVDLPVFVATNDSTVAQEQGSGIGNVALNNVRLRAGKLYRLDPDLRRTRIVTYTPAVADAALRTALPSLGSLTKTVVLQVANYVVQDLALGLSDTLTVRRTVMDSSGVDVTTDIAGFRR